MWKKIVAVIKKLFGLGKNLFVVVASGVRNEVLDVLNDAALQDAARAAVMSAADQGFKDNSAWEYARSLFIEELKEMRRNVAGNIVDALLQTAYTIFKAGE